MAVHQLHHSFIPYSDLIPARTYKEIKEDPATPRVQLVIVTGFLVIAAIFDWEDPAWLALFIGVISLVIPPAGVGIVWFWFRLSLVLGWINTRILLSIVYFLFVSPIAILFRLFGNDPMALKGEGKSIYVWREHTYRPEDLENPW